MLSVAAVASGGISPLTTSRLSPPGAPFVKGTTLRPTTSAQSRGAGWGRATRAHMGRPSMQTAGGGMGRGQMPALSSERPASQPGVEIAAPATSGEEGCRCAQVSRDRDPGHPERGRSG